MRIRFMKAVTCASLALTSAMCFGAGKKFGVDPRDILVELGRLKTVGGQEDLIIDVASRLAAEKEQKIHVTQGQ